MKPLGVPKIPIILVATNLADHPSLMLLSTCQARSSGAGILLVHVVPPIVTPKKPPYGEVQVAPENISRDVREQLEYAALQLQWQGVLSYPIVLIGDPAVQIAALARLKAASQVVVGPRRAGSSAGHLRPSLAERLIPELDIPLLVLGPRLPVLHAAGGGHSKLIVPLSLRGSQSEYVRFAIRLAQESCSRLTLLHVANTSDMTQRQREQAYDDARFQLAALVPESSLPFPVETIVRDGDIVRAIVNEPICPYQDLIVMGTSPASRHQAQHSAIIRQVITGARCPVMVHSCAREDVGFGLNTASVVSDRSKAS